MPSFGDSFCHLSPFSTVTSKSRKSDADRQQDEIEAIAVWRSRHAAFRTVGLKQRLHRAEGRSRGSSSVRRDWRADETCSRLDQEANRVAVDAMSHERGNPI